jgi:hypothetical protein
MADSKQSAGALADDMILGRDARLGSAPTYARLARLAVERATALKLDLAGLHVLTEAATGPYAATAVIAAAAGAKVTALARDSRHGSVAEISDQTMALAAELRVRSEIAIVETITENHISSADVVTNSGHLRPLDAAVIGRMKPSAVIPLMYEAWELRATDVDLEACRARGIRLAGTNERHPSVGVFDFLGPVVVKAMLNMGHALIDERCLLVCDNDFGPYIERSLERNGARVTRCAVCADIHTLDWDVVVIATTPVLSGGCVVDLAGIRADAFCQLWGDVDRASGFGSWLP